MSCAVCCEGAPGTCGCDGPPPPEETPTATCPKCRAEVPDYDGFGVLAHCQPYYADGCGYCSHPSRDNGVCGICGGSK